MSTSDEHRVYEILDRLISYPTITGDIVAQDACLRYAADLLENAGLSVKMHYSKGVPSLVASTRGGNKASKLILQSHIDVVPASKNLYNLQRKDDRLIGRGTFDMKFAAACFLAASEALVDQNADLDYDIMLTCDEEVGGENGSKHLLNNEGYESELCLLPDGGYDWAIEDKAKGIWFVTVSTDGRSAHGSRPWEGENATHKLLDFLCDTRELFPIGEPSDTTVVISQLEGGSVINQVPDGAKATLDIRFLDDKAKSELETKLYDLAHKHDVRLATHTLVQATKLDTNLTQVDIWKELVQTQTSQGEVGHCLSLGSSDAHYFSEAGIPTMVTRPRGGDPHGPEEWIHEKELYEFYDTIAAFIPRVALADQSAK